MPKWPMPWTAPMPKIEMLPSPPHAYSPGTLMLAAAVGLLLIAVFSLQRQQTSAPSPPATASPAPAYGGRDPLVTIAFKLLNTTGDGRLTLPQLTEGSKSMWDVAAPALRGILRLSDDSPDSPGWQNSPDVATQREQAVAKAFYAMDDDSDGVVLEPEFQTYVRNVRKTYDPVLTILFSMIDVSGSGSVNQKEFAAAIMPVHGVAKDATLLALGVDPAATDSPFVTDTAASTEGSRSAAAAALRRALASTFAEIDRNGDGAVSHDEFQRHFQALALKV